MVLHGRLFVEIVAILFNSNEYYLLCQAYSVLKYDEFYNSVIISKEKTENCFVINIKDLKLNKTFNKMILQNQVHVVANTLDFRVFSNL